MKTPECKRHGLDLTVWDFGELGVVYTCEICEDEKKQEYMETQRMFQSLEGN